MPVVKKMSPSKNNSTQTSPRAKTKTDRVNIFDDAVPASELPDIGLKFLIFGESGSGKTTLACDFQKPLLMIRPEEVEDGSLSIRKIPGVIVTPPVTDPDQIMDICEGQKRTNKYKTIVLDGVLAIQYLTVKKHMGLADVPVQMTWGMVPQADWNRINITLQDYLRELLRLAILGTNIIIVGAQRDMGDRESSEIAQPKIMVSLSPGSVDFIHKSCDYNIHTFIRQAMKNEPIKAGDEEIPNWVPKLSANGQPEIEFVAHIAPTGIYATKFRKDKNFKLPDVMIDPTFAKLNELIRKSR